MAQSTQLTHIKDMVVVAAIVGLSSSSAYLGMRASKAETALEQSRAQQRVLLQKVQQVDESFARIRDYTATAHTLIRPEQSIIERQKDSFTRRALPMSESWTYESWRADLLQTHKSDTDAFLYHVDRIDEVRSHADMLTRRLAGLADILKANKSLMNAIPSILPVEGGAITSEFGVRLSPFEGKRHMHAGLDIAAEIGTKILAPADALVSFVGDFDDMGKTVVLDHGNGILTRFGHTSSSFVKQGQKVKRGQQIAAVGNTGRSTGPHLHYEIWVGSNPVNPREFLFDMADGPTSVPLAAATKPVERLPMPHVKMANLRQDTDL